MAEGQGAAPRYITVKTHKRRAPTISSPSAVRRKPVEATRAPTLAPTKGQPSRGPSADAVDARTYDPLKAALSQAAAQIAAGGQQKLTPVKAKPSEASKLAHLFLNRLTHTATPATMAVGGPKITSLPARVATDVAQTVITHPKKQIPRLLKDTGESLLSIPAGIARTVTSPKAAVEGIAKDYSRRYGPYLNNTPRKQRLARLEKEGVAPEVFDIAGAAAGEAGLVGRALQPLAKAGKLGAKAEKIATVRPGLRVSGDVVRDQPLSPNFIRNANRAALDKARGKVQATRAGREEASGLVREAQAQGQVTMLSKRLQDRAQAKTAAGEKGMFLHRMKSEQQQQFRESLQNVKSLSEPEQKAFKYATQFGLPSDPAKAVEWLQKHRESVVAERAARTGKGKTLNLKRDELKAIDDLLVNPDAAFTPRLREVVTQEAARERRVSALDPGLDPQQAQLRRHMPQAELLGLTREAGESNAAWLRRVRQEGSKVGLERPGYFPSEKRPEGVFSTFAVGGARAVAGTKAYTGELLRTGRENAAIDVLPRSIAKNIKRRYNWNLVANQFDNHTFGWSKDKTVGQLKDEIEQRGIDPNTVAFWNPRLYREHQQGHLDAVTDPTEEDVTGGQSGRIADAVSRATVDPRTMAVHPEDFKKSGWQLVPKAAYEEIAADLRPSGAAGRIYDVTKGKFSRVLLGNPGWLQFQTASNAFLTGLSGTGPVDAVKAQLWWRKLDHDKREAISPYIGVHNWYDEQTHLGSTVNNRMVNAYRAFKDTRVYSTLHKGNPLDLIFKADNAQNNFFRKAVLYSKVKKDAYRQMGQEMGQMQRIQAQAMNGLKLGPHERMAGILDNFDDFERHAKAVNDFLGDYTTYTKRERRTFGRFAMFYGFLRYSLKFTFYTMPIDHPLMSSILGQMGRLEKDELKEIFGGDVPPWEVGNLYTRNGERKYDLARLNPFFNATQQFRGPQAIAGMLSPAAQIAINQVASKNVAFDRAYTTGQGTARAMKASDLSFAQRAKIALSEALKTSLYYRTAEKAGVPGVAKPLRGKQGSGSSLLFPQPLTYKRSDAIANNYQLIQRQNKQGSFEPWKEALAPLLGAQGSQDIASAQAYGKSKGKRKPKQTTQSGGYNIGSGGSISAGGALNID